MNTTTPPADRSAEARWENEGGAQPPPLKDNAWRDELSKHWQTYIPSAETVARTAKKRHHRDDPHGHGRRTWPL